MKPHQSKSLLHQRKEYATKLILISLFGLLFISFIFLTGKSLILLEAFELKFLDLFLLGLATLRLGRLISYDLVMQPLRSPFTQTVTDTSGSGDTVEAKGSGMRRAIGEMLSCPICTGTWVAAFLVYSLVLFPGPTRVFLVLTAVIGMVEILNALLEMLSWIGSYARVLNGSREQLAASFDKHKNHPRMHSKTDEY